MQPMNIPENYHHKATSESFNKADKVSIYYSREHHSYLIEINDDESGEGYFLTRNQLALLVHAGTDVLDMDK